MASQQEFIPDKDFRELPVKEVEWFMEDHHFHKEQYAACDTPVTPKVLEVHGKNLDYGTKNRSLDTHDENMNLVTLSCGEDFDHFGRAITYDQTNNKVRVNKPDHFFITDEGRYLGVFREKNPNKPLIPIRVIEYSPQFASKVFTVDLKQ